MNAINLKFTDLLTDQQKLALNKQWDNQADSAPYRALHDVLKKREKEYNRLKKEAEKGNLTLFVGKYVTMDDQSQRQKIIPAFLQAQLNQQDTNTDPNLILGKQKLAELSGPEYKQDVLEYMKTAPIEMLQAIYSRDANAFETVFTNETLKQRFNRAGRFSALMKCAALHRLPQGSENRPYSKATIELQQEIANVSWWDCIRTFSFRKTVHLRNLRQQFDKNPSSISRHELEVIVANEDYCKRFCGKTLSVSQLQDHIKTLKQAESKPIERVTSVGPKVPAKIKAEKPQQKKETSYPLTSSVNACTVLAVSSPRHPRYSLSILDTADKKLSSFSRIMQTLLTDYQYDVIEKSQNAVGPVLVRTNSTFKRNYSPRLISEAKHNETYVTDETVINEIDKQWQYFESEMKETNDHPAVRKTITLLAKVSQNLAKHYATKCTKLETLEQIFKDIKENFTKLLPNFGLKQDDLVVNDIEHLTYDEAHKMCHPAVTDIVKIIPDLYVAEDKTELLETVKNKLSSIFAFIAWADVTFYGKTPDDYIKYIPNDYVNEEQMMMEMSFNSTEDITEMDFESECSENIEELSFDTLSETEEHIMEMSFDTESSKNIEELSFDTLSEIEEQVTEIPFDNREENVTELSFESYNDLTLFGQQKSTQGTPSSRSIILRPLSAG